MLYHLFGNNHIAEGLGHFAPLTIHCPPMCKNRLIGCLAFTGNGCEKGGLEPTAVLVSAFQIQIRRPFEIRTGFQHRRVGRAGIKPNVHNVFFFSKMTSAAVGAFRALGQNLIRTVGIPCIRTLFAEQLRNRLDKVAVNDGLTAVLAVENRDGNPPKPLTGYTPVAAFANHGNNSLFTPSRQPSHAADGLNGVVLEAFHRAKPLLGGAEQNRFLAAPTMGILVNKLFHGKQRTGCLHVLCNRLVCIICSHSRANRSGFICHYSVTVNRHNDGKILIVSADIEVVNTMTGCSVNAAGTAFKGYMVADNNHGFAI